MRLNFNILRGIFLLFLFLSLQNCTKNSPEPVSIYDKSASSSNVDLSKSNVEVKREEIMVSASANAKSNEGDEIAGTNLLPACYDVYYNLDTGEVLDRVFIGKRCDGGDPNPPTTGGGTPSSGGGGSTSGSSSEGEWTTTATTDTYNKTPPADCGSWLFIPVGPSGYQACGVANMRISVLAIFRDNSGKVGVDYFRYKFKNPIFFEMPSRYSSGEAATICADLKDKAEKFIQGKYGNTEVNSLDEDGVGRIFKNYLTGSV